MKLLYRVEEQIKLLQLQTETELLFQELQTLKQGQTSADRASFSLDAYGLSIDKTTESEFLAK